VRRQRTRAVRPSCVGRGRLEKSLNAGSLDASARNVAGFRKGLNESGYIEGQNVTVDYHWLDGQYDRLPAIIAELVRRLVAVIASAADATAPAVKAATATIPCLYEFIVSCYHRPPNLYAADTQRCVITDSLRRCRYRRYRRRRLPRRSADVGGIVAFGYRRSGVVGGRRDRVSPSVLSRINHLPD
jgi:hypothetical protein